ncbi:hypothetical protein K438DRAFT_2037048 [Mycena galopus ATCC 62051]|nr:hypothetical protein K438DRAFT_2037048 [Mycena galopus ATCC 62051]
MPHQLSVTGIRFNNITAHLTPVLMLLNDLNDTFGPPFIKPISVTTVSLITAAEFPSATPTGSCGEVWVALKIHTFVGQQSGNKIKQFLHQIEMNTLLKDCRTGLDHALEVFKIGTGVTLFNSIDEMKKTTEMMHKQLLELISTLSEGTTSDTSSLVYRGVNGSQNSSNSFCMLPPRPKIFYGREFELNEIMKILGQQSPRIAILGGGGMGKTSLARAVLHHPDTLAKFEQRFFVSAEPAANSIELAALIGLHVGLDPRKDLTKPVVQYFSRRPPSLLILDNLETPWEPKQSRGGVEEFLSLLTDVPHLSLIITMRGTERPAKVRWTHPFPSPLKPLSDEAAQQTFIDITDNSCNSKEMAQLLRFTDNMPLAVDLIAHLVDYEGPSSVLTRWETEKTSLLSTHYGRKSSLDASIALSISSPRITSGAKELLSLLSILPDGLSDAELIQSSLPIPNILGHKATLLSTSLAYQDDKKRLRLLKPIRDHIQQLYPPSQILIQSLAKHFHFLLKLDHKYKGQQRRPIVNQITVNLGNLQEVLRRGLHTGNPDLQDTIYCTLALNSFYRVTRGNWNTLMEYIPPVFPQPCDHRLEISFLIEVLRSNRQDPTLLPEDLISQVKSHFEHFNDLALESLFYWAVSGYSECDPHVALQFLEKALRLSRLCGDTKQQSNILVEMSCNKLSTGDYGAAQFYSFEGRKLANLSSNLYQVARARHVEARCSRYLGDYQKSMVQLQRAREELEMCGMSGGRVDHDITIDQAETHRLKSEYAEARSIHTELLQNTSLDQNATAHAYALLNFAQIDTTIGVAAEDVNQNLHKAAEIFSTVYPAGIPLCDTIWADMELREGNFMLAKVKLLQCLHWAQGRDNEAVSFCLERLANVKLWQPSEWQSVWPAIYLAHALKSKERLANHKALLFLGDVFISNGDEDTAHNIFTVALEGFTYMDVHHSRAQCLLRLGDLANKRGEASKAAQLWKEAQALFERSSQAKDVVQIDIRLAMLDEACQKSLAHLMTLSAPVQSLQQLSFGHEAKSTIKEKPDDTVDKDFDEAQVLVAV